jgi:ABC-type sugar transport system permease subunit
MTAAANIGEELTVAAGRRFRQRGREEVAAWLFLSPSIIAFVVFTLVPAIATFVLTFYRWDFTSPPVFVGLQNWATLFSLGGAGRSVLVTVLLCVITIPISIGIGLVLALALDRMPIGKVFFRSIFFVPIVTSLVAISFVFRDMFATETGLINYVLGLVGIAPVGWLTYPASGLTAVAIMMVWSMTGLCMLVYLAGLQQIDESLLEASQLDGANRWQQFFHVVRPMLARSTLFLVVIQTIGGLQTFEAVFILTNGGPGDATTTIGLYVYKASFRSYDVGAGATASIALFALMLAVTVFQFYALRDRHDG